MTGKALARVTSNGVPFSSFVHVVYEKSVHSGTKDFTHVNKGPSLLFAVVTILKSVFNNRSLTVGSFTVSIKSLALTVVIAAVGDSALSLCTSGARLTIFCAVESGVVVVNAVVNLLDSPLLAGTYLGVISPLDLGALPFLLQLLLRLLLITVMKSTPSEMSVTAISSRTTPAVYAAQTSVAGLIIGDCCVVFAAVLPL